jgi:glucokinase
MQAKQAKSTQATQLIVADVGGTHARFAIATYTEEQAIGLHAFAKFLCSDFASLSEVLRTYCVEHFMAQNLDVVMAIAAPIVDGEVVAQANMPWRVQHAVLQHDFPQQQIHLLNDFVALAHAVPTIKNADANLLCGPDFELGISVKGPVLVIGPGTGLGAAIWLPGAPSTVLASEAGHAALAACSDIEIAILQCLKKRWQHVDVERILSGPGLMNCYQALCEIDMKQSLYATPAEIAQAAMQAQDALAVQSLSVFCGWLGSIAADLSIIVGAQRVILAGGIPSQILPFLQASEFAARFKDKGVMSPVMEKISVQVIEHGQLALLGAAQWYLETEILN